MASKLNGSTGGSQWKARPSPRQKLTINVGITGHRACLLPAPVIDALEPVLEEVFASLRDAAHSIDPGKGLSRNVRLRLHTPLASGADQLAAKSAHATGYKVHALLP